MKRRRENWDYLRENLKDVEDYFILPEKQTSSEPCWFGFIVMAKPESGVSRDKVVHYLEEHNIQTRNLFAGNITRHPCFEHLKEGEDYRIVGGLSNTDAVMYHGFWVGVYPGMTDEMIDYMAKTIKEAVNQ